MHDLVGELGPRGTLLADLTPNDAADIIWGTASTELFILFTTERKWSSTTYRRWLADTWCRLLLNNSNMTHSQ